MSYDLNISGSMLSKIIDSAMHPSWQDVVDGLHTSISPQSVTGGSETTFTNNGSVRNEHSFPDHITNLWSTSTNVASFSEELNTPLYGARLEMTINPSTTGTIDFMAYINDDTPKLIQTTVVPYKNSVGRVSVIFTFYLGQEVGYNLKDDGVYFTFTSSGNIDVYDKTLLIYRT